MPKQSYPADIDPEMAAKRWPGGFTLRDEANAIVACAFRNGPIENLHAGERSEILDDARFSRITNPEMKKLMMFACARVAALLRFKEEEPEAYRAMVMNYNLDYCDGWQRSGRYERPRYRQEVLRQLLAGDPEAHRRLAANKTLRAWPTGKKSGGKDHPTGQSQR